MLAIDTETTGLDLHHGARPYLVTTCDGEGNQRNWCWDVDPLTREVLVDHSEVCEIQSLIDRHAFESGELVFHNGKFDIRALGMIGIDVENWPWNLTHDTLIGAHLLRSNWQKDLGTLAVMYLDRDISDLEKELKKVCDEARRYARAHHPDWAIAKEGRPDMPSAKKEVWKYDTWLPLLLAKERNLPPDHPWNKVTWRYAVADSATTVLLWQFMKGEIQRRDLWPFYEARMEMLRSIYLLEENGVTVSRSMMDELESEYRTEYYRSATVCTNIAKGYGGYELEIGKKGDTDSLKDFCFGPASVVPDASGKKTKKDRSVRLKSPNCLDLPVLKTSDKTGDVSLDKGTIDEYLATLPPRSKALKFIRELSRYRKRGTSLGYLESYRKFLLPLEYSDYGCDNPDSDPKDYGVIYTSVNPTGTDTLRYSSSNPNTQQISKLGLDQTCPKCGGEGLSCTRCAGEGTVAYSLRYCFGPSPGWEWWSMDAKNLEARIPAYLSGEPDLIGLYEKPDEPPYYGSAHILNFSIVYPEIWETELTVVGIDKVGPHCKKKYADTYYQWCKNGGFAVQYGAVFKENGWGTADKAFHRRYAHKLLLDRFEKLRKLDQDTIRFAKKYGYVETVPDREIDPTRGYPLMVTRTEHGRVLETVPLNYKVQGTACWWMVKAMIRCQRQLDEWKRSTGFIGKMVLTVHDELVFAFPKSRVSPSHGAEANLLRARILRKLMERGGDDIGIPTPCSMEYHDTSWGEGVSLE